MTFVLLFVLSGAVAARYFENKKYRVALVCHSVAFTVALVYISFMPGLSAGAFLWSRVLGEQTASSVRDVLYGISAGGAAAMVIISALVSLTALQTAFIAASAAQKLSAAVLKLAKTHETLPSLSAYRAAEPGYIKHVSAERRYITLCSWLC